MFNLIQRAYQQSKPFLSSSYQAVSSGVTAAGYVLKTGADVVVVGAYTTKAAVKTVYYGAKGLVTVVPAAYRHYTKQAPKAKAPSAPPSRPGFDFDAYDETRDDYDQAWDDIAEGLFDTGSEFVSNIYAPGCDAVHSAQQAAYYTLDSAGHGLEAAGKGILLAGSAAKYFLSSESLVKDKLGDDNEYVFVEAPKSPVFSGQAPLLAALAATMPAI